MKIESYKLTYKKLDAIKPIPVKGIKLSKREIYILEVLIDNKIYSSELAPLPGINNIELEQAKTQLEQCLSHLIKNTIEQLDITKPFLGLDIPFNVDSSVLFTLEGLFLNFLVPEKLQSVDINELIPIEDLKHLNNMKGSYKIKVKGSEWKKHSRELLTFIDNNPNAFIKLDGNLSFNMDQYISFSKVVPQDSVIYFEEPLQDIRQYTEIPNSLNYPYALDENLINYQDDKDINTIAWIIKPQLFGVSRSIQLIYKAFENGITPVISSCFEGSLGMRTLIQIINIPDLSDLLRIPHGLGTFRYLKEQNPQVNIMYGENLIISKNS